MLKKSNLHGIVVHLRGFLGHFSSASELKHSSTYLLYKQAGSPHSNLGDTPQNHKQGASLNAAKEWNSAPCRLCWIWEMVLFHRAA